MAYCCQKSADRSLVLIGCIEQNGPVHGIGGFARCFHFNPLVVRTPESARVQRHINCIPQNCRKIMAIYFSNSHKIILKFHWQPSIFCNAEKII